MKLILHWLERVISGYEEPYFLLNIHDEIKTVILFTVILHLFFFFFLVLFRAKGSRFTFAYLPPRLRCKARNFCICLQSMLSSQHTSYVASGILTTAFQSRIHFHKVATVVCLKCSLGAPGWLSRLTNCLRLRSWSQGPAVGLLAWAGSLLLLSLCLPLPLLVLSDK